MVDKIIYDIIDENGIESRSNVINKFSGKYDEDILNECYDEIDELIKKTNYILRINMNILLKTLKKNLII